MKMIEFTTQEINKLKKIIAELDTFYEENENGKVKVWNFADVDVQREIALDIANILRNKI
jgi:hypothetical protein